MCKTRFQLRTSDEILNRLEALSSVSGESKNAVANVLLAMQLGNVKCDVSSIKSKNSTIAKKPKESTVVHDDGDEKPSDECDVSGEKVSSPPTPPTPSKKKKEPKGSQKEKDSSKIALGNGRKPKSFEACVEYFEYRRIPDFRDKARQFYDYYEANGWVMGRSPIRKWSCCLTTWISHNDGWEPVEIDEPKNVELKKILAWMKKEHEEWYEKFKGVKNINEIDGYYIDEFRGA